MLLVLGSVVGDPGCRELDIIFCVGLKGLEERTRMKDLVQPDYPMIRHLQPQPSQSCQVR